MATYLDCNATTPVEPRVRDLVIRYMETEFGNAGSRTHDFGARAKQGSQRARDQIADLVEAERDEVLFTSGATEANNLAILGLLQYGARENRRHIISTAIEHKSVLEPLARMGKDGFDITIVPPEPGGWVSPMKVAEALREDTLLVSVMHVNNETGVAQPLMEIAKGLRGHTAFLHVDAAQGFGKERFTLRDPRIDMISISGHKLYAPKGVGALIARRRGFDRIPLEPLMVGGGQERGLRPGTLPVHLVVGLGLACEIASQEEPSRTTRNNDILNAALMAFAPLRPRINGDRSRCLPHVLNLTFPGIDSEAIMVAWKGLAAVSNGAACTSQSYSLSHVLKAMGSSDEEAKGSVRLSWCHMTGEIDWEGMAMAVKQLM